MRTKKLLACAGALLPAALALNLAAPERETVKVGTYDNRSIAIAYASSDFNPVGQKMKEFEEAKAAGDEARVAELEAWGPKHQRELHRMGFCTMPVNELLDHLEDRLPELAEELGVDVITRECDYTGPDVEVVDVTDALVRLFDPSEKALRWAAEIREKAPLHLDDLDHED